LQSKNIQKWVFGIILVLLFIVVCKIFSPFFSVFLWSTLLFILFSPLHHKIAKNITSQTLKGRIAKTCLAALFSIFTVILIVLPLSFIVYQFFIQIRELTHSASALFDENPEFLENVNTHLSHLVFQVTGGNVSVSPEQISSQVKSIIRQSFQWSLEAGSGIIKNVGGFVINLVLMIFCLFFFYLDAMHLMKLITNAIFIRRDYMQELTKKFKDTTRSLFMGYLLVSLIQGIIAFIIFVIFRIESALVFAILTLICAFIPMLGAGVVWLPLGIFTFFINGEIVKGIVFMILCGGIISTLDNILRPLFLQDRVKLHPLVIFFSILGGIISFGFNGLILGPMLVIIFLTVLDLFLIEHKIIT
jgi:predicted PurR-regulated permease PerM